jgi:hypothetical protein
MTTDLQLCPCCAAHLRVPAQLHTMRCNTCDAELVALNEGGVRGLALIPGVVPYSHPDQRARNFDGRELLNFRRGHLLQAANRSEARWGGMFFLTLGLLGGAFLVGIGAARGAIDGDRETLEACALALLCAITAVPILAYTALYFQGRARLVRESVRRWM